MTRTEAEQAVIAAARAERDAAVQARDNMAALCQSAEDDNAALRAEVARLRGALAPFAKAADAAIDGTEPKQHNTYGHTIGLCLTVGDFRTASAALEPQP